MHSTMPGMITPSELSFSLGRYCSLNLNFDDRILERKLQVFLILIMNTYDKKDKISHKILMEFISCLGSAVVII